MNSKKSYSEYCRINIGIFSNKIKKTWRYVAYDSVGKPKVPLFMHKRM